MPYQASPERLIISLGVRQIPGKTKEWESFTMELFPALWFGRGREESSWDYCKDLSLALSFI